MEVEAAPPPNCADSISTLLDSLGQGGTAILQTVFGEDSWNFIGTGSYKDGEAYSRKGGSGAKITKSDVSTEVTYMADVILNRAAASGKSIGDVVSAPNQFLGYTIGLKALGQAYASNVGSNECDHLMTAATAIAGQLTKVDHKDVRSWRAVQQGSPGRARTRRPSDIRIANTDFF